MDIVLLPPGGGRELVGGEMMLLEAGELRLRQLVPILELQGRTRALVHRVFYPRRGGNVTLALRVAYGLLGVNSALISQDIRTCSY
jgi:hypothetical protein